MADDRIGLTRFTSELNKVQGLYKPNLYMVEFVNYLEDFWAMNNSEWSSYFQTQPRFFANSANLPGIQIITSDHRRQGFGTFDRRPFGAMVTDIPITFMVDNQGEMLGFFNNWMNNVVNYNMSGGEHKIATTSGASAGLFEVRYPDAYKCGIKITCLDHTGEYIITYTLHEAFPMQMGDISVAWAETDQFTSLPVQFTFRSYNTDKQPVPSHVNSPRKKGSTENHFGKRNESYREYYNDLAGAVGKGGYSENLKQRHTGMVQSSTQSGFHFGYVPPDAGELISARNAAARRQSQQYSLGQGRPSQAHLNKHTNR